MHHCAIPQGKKLDLKKANVEKLKYKDLVGTAHGPHSIRAVFPPNWIVVRGPIFFHNGNSIVEPNQDSYAWKLGEHPPLKFCACETTHPKGASGTACCLPLVIGTANQKFHNSRTVDRS